MHTQLSGILKASDRVGDENAYRSATLRPFPAVRYIGNIRTPASVEYLLGGSVEQVVNVTFAVHVTANDMASWVTAFGACGLVHAESERRYVVTVRRAGAMEYLETVLNRGDSLGVLSWQTAAP